MATRRRKPTEEDGFLAFCAWLDNPDADPDAYVWTDGSWWARDDIAPKPERTPPPREVAARLLTLAEAGDLMRASPETIRFWIWQGKLEAFRPGRRVLVREADLLALVDDSEGNARRARARKARRT
jgi:excisionase family DNA binding protein